MRTLLFLVGGALLLGAFVLLGRVFATQYPEASRIATISYVVVWLVVAGANMWVGVSKAGYSVADELPIFLLIFGVPAALALVLRWQFP